ncbi:MAG: hypothetical protein QF886_08980, partial [Planctomycetota bacterium]|nr:hypothetical protein [Planctomycetota bacterium]
TADLSTTPIRHSAERSRPITQPATQKPTLKPEWETKELRAAAGPGLHPGNAGAKGAMMLIRMKSIGGTLKRMRDLASQVQPVFAQMISLQNLVAICGFPPDRHQMIRNSVVTTKPLAMIVYPSDASLKGEPEACLMIPVKDGHRIEPLIAQKVTPQAVAKVDGDYLFIGKSAVVFDRIMQDFGVIRNIPVSDFSGDVQVNVFVPNTKHLIVFEIEEELANAREQARSSKDPEDIADLKMQQLVAGIFLTMLDELTQANFGLSFEKTGLRFSQSLIAAPNSKTAGVLSELASQPGQSIAGRMPQSDAIALGDLSISGPAFARLAEGFIQDAFKIAVDTKSISDDDLPAARGVKESAMAALRSWSGSLAFSILPAEQGGAFILALGGNLGRTIGEFIDAMERAEPIKGEVRWRSFKGVKVQSLAETAGKNQGLVTFEIAHLPDLSILSFGTSIQWATDAAIDSSRSRGGLPRDLADIRASFTEKPLGTMSLKLMKLAAAVEKEEGSETSAQLAEQLAMTDVPILGALFIKKDRVSEQLFISVTTMRNLQAFIMTKMQGTK